VGARSTIIRFRSYCDSKQCGKPVQDICPTLSLCLAYQGFEVLARRKCLESKGLLHDRPAIEQWYVHVVIVSFGYVQQVIVE